MYINFIASFRSGRFPKFRASDTPTQVTELFPLIEAIFRSTYLRFISSLARTDCAILARRLRPTSFRSVLRPESAQSLATVAAAPLSSSFRPRPPPPPPLLAVSARPTPSQTRAQPTSNGPAAPLWTRLRHYSPGRRLWTQVALATAARGRIGGREGGRPWQTTAAGGWVMMARLDSCQLGSIVDTLTYMAGR